ncbi:FCD domain-containing protein [Ewingella americana]|jgi:GntR family uxuAB operon transcriptional repressor|uniref:FCD domain-containing protein n=1 Tax=Ewingella americana TaxID=41202 RepID=A0A502GR45_9GAMM|nr:FCD domain-containing protein [Ewingella americana]TPG63466.1 FCD domain-containing protein [Ewingella americana]
MRLYQEIGGKLRSAIEAGDYLVGDRLPPERDIAETFSVSRSVVREALIMLELEKRVEVRKGSGVYVLPRQPEANIFRGDTGYGPFELLQARQLLESEVAAFAAMQATKNDILKMRDAIDQERGFIERGEVDETADELFHTLLAQASQNSVLANMVVDLWQIRKGSAMWQGIQQHVGKSDHGQQWLLDHQKILQAILRRDPKAAKQAMWQHLENVKIMLLEVSDAEDPAFDGFLFESIPAVLNK